MFSLIPRNTTLPCLTSAVKDQLSNALNALLVGHVIRHATVAIDAVRNMHNQTYFEEAEQIIPAQVERIINVLRTRDGYDQPLTVARVIPPDNIINLADEHCWTAVLDGKEDQYLLPLSALPGENPRSTMHSCFSDHLAWIHPGLHHEHCIASESGCLEMPSDAFGKHRLLRRLQAAQRRLNKCLSLRAQLASNDISKEELAIAFNMFESAAQFQIPPPKYKHVPIEALLASTGQSVAFLAGGWALVIASGLLPYLESSRDDLHKTLQWAQHLAKLTKQIHNTEAKDTFNTWRTMLLCANAALVLAHTTFTTNWESRQQQNWHPLGNEQENANPERLTKLRAQNLRRAEALARANGFAAFQQMLAPIQDLLQGNSTPQSETLAWANLAPLEVLLFAQAACLDLNRDLNNIFNS